ncbi:M50 family metallopeptidase, partial [Escherichia coli]|nr:M50 family metallopeptidase [Escherichia coli]
TIGGFFFTVFSGLVISGILLSIAKYARSTIVNFPIAFITVQMLLNATFDLINVFVISTTTNMHSDAANRAASTRIPAFICGLSWIAL